MKLNLNLVSAMTLRKRLNTLANSLEYRLNGNIVVDPEMVEAETARFVTGSYDGDLTLYNKTLYAVGSINQDIEANNLRGKCLLNAIQLARRQVNLYTRATNALAVNHKVKTRNPVSGEWEITEYVDLTKANMKSLLSSATIEKNTAQDALAEYNSKTTFDFEIADEVYNRAYEI